MAANGAHGDSRPVFFFDIDNCVRFKMAEIRYFRS